MICMSDLGLGLIQQFIELTRQNSLLERIPQRFRPAVTLILGFLPLAIFTLLAPTKLVPVLAILTVPYFYVFSKSMEADLFSIPKKDVFMCLMIPLETTLVVWAGLLVVLNRQQIFLHTLGFFAALLIIAILPAIRRDEAIKERKVKYEYTYSVVGALFIIQQIMVLVRSFQ